MIVIQDICMCRYSGLQMHKIQTYTNIVIVMILKKVVRFQCVFNIKFEEKN